MIYNFKNKINHMALKSWSDCSETHVRGKLYSETKRLKLKQKKQGKTKYRNT